MKISAKANALMKIKANTSTRVKIIHAFILTSLAEEGIYGTREIHAGSRTLKKTRLIVISLFPADEEILWSTI